MKKIITLLFAMASLSIFAQRNCATNDYLEIQKTKDHFLQEKMDQIEEHTRNFSQSNFKTSGTVYTIPVVVHVVYNKRKSIQNISDAQINSQIAVLNADFRRLNADANNTWSQAADAEIEFCLASVDPSGNSTTGIIRKSTRKNSFSYTTDEVKFNSSGGSNAWPAGDYLNIWVCDLSSGLLGYAQFPGGSSSTDGVVVDYAYFGTTGTATFPFNLGRTATHEVGHWLNLRHIWGDGPCGVDDFVTDTPESDAYNAGCPSGHVSCTTTDMIENYMDYTDDACMNLFTAGQSSRMRSLFAAGGFRASLLNSNGCGNGGGGGPTYSCTDGVQNGNETGIDCGGPDCNPCSSTGCSDPTGLSSTPKKGGREAELSWNAVSGAISYDVDLKLTSSSTWSAQPFTTSGTAVVATGLTKNASYDWKVRANCSGSSSQYVVQTFIAGQSAREFTFDDVVVYPNPSDEVLNISFHESSTAKFIIYDAMGRMVYSDQLSSTLTNKEISTASFEEGVYILNVINNDHIKTVKFTVVH